MLVLGVTGDVGAGKSTITEIFRQCGASVVSADAVTHEKWRDPAILDNAVRRWGEGVLLPDGRINAPRVASIVFSDMAEYRWLCRMLHPVVREEMGRRISRFSGWVVAEIPLLFENGVPEWIDETLYISASEVQRVERNSSRGWDGSELRRRESFLLSSENKKKMADLVLNNDIPLEDQRMRLKGLSERYRKIAMICRIQVQLFSKEIAAQFASMLLEKELACEIDINCANAFRTDRSGNAANLEIYTIEKSYGKIKDLLEERFPHYSRLVLSEIKRPGTFLRYFPLEVDGE